MKRRLVIYHRGCVDGFTAAWAAWKRFGDEDTEYFPAMHGDAPPDVTGRHVFILDFAYPRAATIEMNEKAMSLTVLDHHEKAQDDLADLPPAESSRMRPAVHFDMNRSGAGIAWDYFHGTPRPKLVNYVEDRDLWRFKLPASKWMNAYINIYPQSFACWDVLSAGLEERPNDFIDIGSGVQLACDHYVNKTAKLARIVCFEGHEVPIVNAPPVNISELVGHLAEKHPFAIGWFQRPDGKYQFSLRSRGDGGVNVNEIAKRYGGGGHRNAAGFTIEKYSAGWVELLLSPTDPVTITATSG